jgi:hypothetical protein
MERAVELRMRSEIAAGKMLRDMAARGERAVRKNMKSQRATSKLAGLGVTNAVEPVSSTSLRRSQLPAAC